MVREDAARPGKARRDVLVGFRRSSVSVESLWLSCVGAWAVHYAHNLTYAAIRERLRRRGAAQLIGPRGARSAVYNAYTLKYSSISVTVASWLHAPKAASFIQQVRTARLLRRLRLRLHSGVSGSPMTPVGGTVSRGGAERRFALTRLGCAVASAQTQAAQTQAAQTQAAAANALDLNSLLITPIQRVPRSLRS